MAIPATPTNFNVQVGNGQAYLTWDIIAGATSYQIQRSTDGVSFSNLGTSSVNNYLDSTGLIGTQYYYQVASVNISGTSPFTSAQIAVPVLTAQMSLGQIRLLAQQRADRVNSNFVTMPEWNTYINQSYFELYDLLVTRFEDEFVAPLAIFQTDGSTFQYPLPDGVIQFQTMTGSLFTAKPFYKLLGVDCGIALNNNAWVTLSKFKFVGRNSYVYPNITSTFLGVFNLQYRLIDNTIMFIPTPSAGQYIRMWYIPKLTQLLKDTDIVDGVSGWTEYIVVDAAIKALTKEESDISALMAQKQALLDRIESTAQNRDAGMPETVSDTRSWGARWGRYGGPGWDGGSFGGY